MARRLPTGLLTSKEIQANMEGAIEEVKFFQLGFITWKIII